MNEVGAEWDVNRRDTASHEIDGMNETRSGEMNDVWLASLHSCSSSLSLFLSFRPAGLTSGASEVTRRTKRDEKPSERRESVT